MKKAGKGAAKHRGVPEKEQDPSACSKNMSMAGFMWTYRADEATDKVELD